MAPSRDRAPERIARERVELLEPHDRDLGARGLLPGGEELVDELAARDDDAADAVRPARREGGVVEDRLERAVGDLVERRDRLRVAQEALR